MTKLRYRRNRYLKNRERRHGRGIKLAPEIMEGLREIAKLENKSVSWVIEETVIDYFQLPKLEYYQAKKNGRKR